MWAAPTGIISAPLAFPETGWVFHADDPAELRKKLGIALTGDLSAFKPRIAARIAGYTYRQATTGLLAALDHVLRA